MVRLTGAVMLFLMAPVRGAEAEASLGSKTSFGSSASLGSSNWILDLVWVLGFVGVCGCVWVCCLDGICGVGVVELVRVCHFGWLAFGEAAEARSVLPLLYFLFDLADCGTRAGVCVGAFEDGGGADGTDDEFG